MQIFRDEQRTILTPEHVEISVAPAGLGSRMLALLLDTLLILMISAVLSIVLNFLPLPGIAAALYISITFLLNFAYHLWFEVRSGGRTPGKRLNRLRVVDETGLPITLEQSVVRNLIRAVDFLPIFYGVGAVSVFVSRDGRRLGDLVGRTLVIEERSDPIRLETGAPSRTFRSLQSPKLLRYVRTRVGLEERELLKEISLRHRDLDERERLELMTRVGEYFREKLEIDRPELSNTNLVLGLAEIVSRL